MSYDMIRRAASKSTVDDRQSECTLSRCGLPVKQQMQCTCAIRNALHSVSHLISAALNLLRSGLEEWRCGMVWHIAIPLIGRKHYRLPLAYFCRWKTHIGLHTYTGMHIFVTVNKANVAIRQSNFNSWSTQHNQHPITRYMLLEHPWHVRTPTLTSVRY
jgi:hypothetical protein